jgi:hypothetical protein
MPPRPGGSGSGLGRFCLLVPLTRSSSSLRFYLLRA